MSEPEHPFLPERVDEQIDALTQAAQEPDTDLISHLRAIYSEDREVVERVEKRLAAYRASNFIGRSEPIDRYSQSSSTLRAGWQKKPRFVKTVNQERPYKRRGRRLLEIAVAVLVIAVLVGSMALVLKTRYSSRVGHVPSTSPVATKKSTPQPTSTISTPKGLYITTTDGIDRIDNLATGKVIWHVGSGATEHLLVDQGIVIFSGGDTTGPGNFSNYYVEAVSASDGELIWRLPYGTIYAVEGAKGIVYVSTCSPSGSCSIDALQTSNGHKLWSYSSSQGTIWELFQDGVVYGVSYIDFFALNAITGAPLWQKTLQKYPYQEASMTPLVDGEAMYFSSCNTTKQTATYQTCGFFAFNAASGAELWHVPYSNIGTSVMAPPTVVDGVVYAGSIDGVIRAYNAQTGSLLWAYNTGGNILNALLSRPGLIYVEVQENTSTMRLLVLKVNSTSHSIAWSKNIHLTEGVPAGILPDIERDRIYLLDSNNDVLAFKADTGDHAQSYHPQVAATMVAFRLVL